MSAGDDAPGALRLQAQRVALARMFRIDADHHIFEVEQEVDGVFFDARDRFKLAQHAFDAHAGNRCARDGRQQHAA
jgi:hypothetical protein